MLNIDTSKVLDKEMNRKQFLRNVGVGIIALTGVTAALRAISQTPASPDVSHQASSAAMRTASAYGGSVYGGTKPRA